MNQRCTRLFISSSPGARVRSCCCSTCSLNSCALTLTNGTRLEHWLITHAFALLILAVFASLVQLLKQFYDQHMFRSVPGNRQNSNSAGELLEVDSIPGGVQRAGGLRLLAWKLLRDLTTISIGGSRFVSTRLAVRSVPLSLRTSSMARARMPQRPGFPYPWCVNLSGLSHHTNFIS